MAFSVFLLFSSDLSLKTNDLQLAKFLIDSFYVLHTDYDELNAMHLYSKFRIYGRLDLPRQSMAAYHELLPKVMDTGNHILIHEMMLCKALFDEMYDGNNKIKYLKRLIKHVDSDIADEFLIVKAYQSDHPEEYIDLMKNQNNDKFLFAQYLLAKHYQSNQDEEKYNNTIHMIETLSDQLSYDIDFNHLLTLDKQKQWVFYKEYLINPCLKKAKKDQNIFMMRHVSQKIVDVLENHNRYKDALNYYSQSEKKIDKIQNS